MKTLRFRLDVTISSNNEMLSAHLSVRDMQTRTSQSLSGFSGKFERGPFGDKLDELFRSIRWKVEGEI